MFSRVLLFLSLGSVLTNVDAFVSPPTLFGNKIDRAPYLNLSARNGADIMGKDKDGNAIRVPVKNIERNWSFDGYDATGEFSADLFVPEDGEVKGCAFFMHGFSQYPVAYYETLKSACESAKVAIIAVETGVTSDIVLSETLKGRLNGLSPQFILQRAVSEDTKQCIKMLLEDDDAFADYGVTKSAVGNNIAVMGHSMGGGLSFPVAADCDIDYVFVMAPAFGEEQFDPIKEGVNKGTPKESMLLAGGWDLIAPAKKVKEISVATNSKINNSSVFVNIARGLHTGFEDEIVLFSVPISSILKGVGFIGKILGIADTFIFNILKVIGFLRTKTGQIEGSTVLMSYFLTAMAEGKDINPEDAEQYLDDNIKDMFEDKFDFSYGGTKN